MSVQLPPVDRRSDFHRIQERAIAPATKPIKAEIWAGDRHRRWTLADALVHTDLIPVAYGALLGALTVLTIGSR